MLETEVFDKLKAAGFNTEQSKFIVEQINDGKDVALLNRKMDLNLMKKVIEWSGKRDKDVLEGLLEITNYSVNSYILDNVFKYLRTLGDLEDFKLVYGCSVKDSYNMLAYHNFHDAANLIKRGLSKEILAKLFYDWSEYNNSILRFLNSDTTANELYGLQEIASRVRVNDTVFRKLDSTLQDEIISIGMCDGSVGDIMEQYFSKEDGCFISDYEKHRPLFLQLEGHGGHSTLLALLKAYSYEDVSQNLTKLIAYRSAYNGRDAVDLLKYVLAGTVDVNTACKVLNLDSRYDIGNVREALHNGVDPAWVKFFVGGLSWSSVKYLIDAGFKSSLVAELLEDKPVGVDDYDYIRGRLEVKNGELRQWLFDNCKQGDIYGAWMNYARATFSKGYGVAEFLCAKCIQDGLNPDGYVGIEKILDLMSSGINGDALYSVAKILNDTRDCQDRGFLEGEILRPGYEINKILQVLQTHKGEWGQYKQASIDIKTVMTAKDFDDALVWYSSGCKGLYSEFQTAREAELPDSVVLAGLQSLGLFN